MRGLDSKVLDGRLENPSKYRPPRYAADLALLMHRLITEGPRQTPFLYGRNGFAVGAASRRATYRSSRRMLPYGRLSSQRVRCRALGYPRQTHLWINERTGRIRPEYWSPCRRPGKLAGWAGWVHPAKEAASTNSDRAVSPT